LSVEMRPDDGAEKTGSRLLFPGSPFPGPPFTGIVVVGSDFAGRTSAVVVVIVEDSGRGSGVDEGVSETVVDEVIFTGGGGGGGGGAAPPQIDDFGLELDKPEPNSTSGPGSGNRISCPSIV
jgi:hypothetical protein